MDHPSHSLHTPKAKLDVGGCYDRIINYMHTYGRRDVPASTSTHVHVVTDTDRLRPRPLVLSLLRQGGQLPHHLALVLLRLHLLVVHHGLEPVVPVADGVIGAAGQPLRNLVPAVAGGRAGVGATARTSGAGCGARHVWPSAGERFGVVDAQGGCVIDPSARAGEGVCAPLVAELVHAVDDVDILGLGERGRAITGAPHDPY